MRELKLTIQIDKPVDEVFEFTLDPKNTPKWVNSIEEEQTNEWPPKLGTIYKNKGQGSDWSEYEITTFEPNKLFVMSQKGTSYHVKYILTPLTNSSCEFEYYEWVDEGELEKPFTLETLQKLKGVIESR